MKNFNITQFLKNNWIHFTAIGLFFLVTFMYFRPQFDGYMLKQHDIEQFQGMAKEVKDFREKYGEEPLWTNSMFGGMPTYQISTEYSGNWMTSFYRFLRLGIASPAGMFFLYLIGFYIAAACFRIKPVIGLFGSLAFAFSSYNIIILQAGHNSKAAAIALSLPVIGAFYVAFRRNMKWGILLSALFMGIEIAANHLQITYYLAILLVFMGLAELVHVFKTKEFKRFILTAVGVAIAYLFAIGLNYGNISLTNDYAKHTIRGGNDLTINPDGTSNAGDATAGLSKDYILQWSNGIDESFTLISPYVKGGASSTVKDSPFGDKLKSADYRKDASLIADNNLYWGDQLFVSGPVYLGIILVFLAFLSLVYAKGPLRWGLFGAAILCLMLAWGKNFMGLTDFFLDVVPGYNKFRAVTIILSIVGIIIPLMAVLFIQQLVKHREELAKNLKPLFISSGVFFAALIFLTFNGLGDGYMSQQENEFISGYEENVRAQIKAEDPQVLLSQYGIDVANEQQLQEVINRQSANMNKQFDALTAFRADIYRESLLRSILYALVAFGLIFSYLKFSMRHELMIAGLTVFAVIDLVSVDWNYLNTDKKGSKYAFWMEEEKYQFPHFPNQADLSILENEARNKPELQEELRAIDALKTAKRGGEGVSTSEKWAKKFAALNFATNYRVYEPQGLTSSTRASYFHKSIGGYHGAKLRRIQNLFDFHFGKGNMAVLNMLNVKYILQGDQVQNNPSALGNAWFVKEVDVRESANEEIQALGTLFQVKKLSPELDVKKGVETISEIELTINEANSLTVSDEPLDLTKAMRSGVNSTYVEDINGRRDWIPTNELAKDSLNSFKSLLSLSLSSQFDPRTKAVVEQEVAEALGTLTYSGDGTISLTSYKPNEMVYKVSIPADNQLAVFSEIYYPDGWVAEVNGEELPIHRVNYLLRGIQLPAGNYDLTMKFEVAKFKSINTWTMIGSILLVLMLLGFFFKDFVLTSSPQKND